jgi:hypothetical protein
MKTILIIFLFVNVFAIDLKNLDKQRMPIEEGFIQTDITFINKKGKVTKKIYKILRKDSRNSLVIFAHKSEKGSLVVKEQDNMYIKTGRSKRAVRISPIQRLVGDSSVGDILEVKFKNYYKISSQEGDILFLDALDDKSTYAKIKVYLKKDKLFKADLFSYSGKKLKTIFYEKTPNAKYIDKLRFVSRKGESIAILSGYKPKKLPSKLFKKRNIKNLYQLSKKYIK